MTPEEGVRAHPGLQGGDAAGVLLPVHRGTFNLAPHPWAEPGEWMADAAGTVGQTAALPRPGEPFEPAGELPAESWWRTVPAPVVRHWSRAGARTRPRPSRYRTSPPPRPPRVTRTSPATADHFGRTARSGRTGYRGHADLGLVGRGARPAHRGRRGRPAGPRRRLLRHPRAGRRGRGRRASASRPGPGARPVRSTAHRRGDRPLRRRAGRRRRRAGPCPLTTKRRPRPTPRSPRSHSVQCCPGSRWAWPRERRRRPGASATPRATPGRRTATPAYGGLALALHAASAVADRAAMAGAVTARAALLTGERVPALTDADGIDRIWRNVLALMDRGPTGPATRAIGDHRPNTEGEGAPSPPWRDGDGQ